MELRNDGSPSKEMYSALLVKVEELMRDFTVVLEENKYLRNILATALKENEELRSVNEELKSENKRLREEISELRGRLNMNSRNSSKPPSSDGLSKKPGLPKGPPKKSGGQPGHKGDTLRMVERADEVVLHHAGSCPVCEKVFGESDVVEIIGRRQVFDIPEPRLLVTEHRTGLIRCCGHSHCGVFPADVTQPTQYGPRILANCVVLNNDYKVPVEKIGRLGADLWGCKLNAGTILAANARMYAGLEAVEATIKQAILASGTVCFDETGLRAEQKLHWCHTACTALFTHLFVHPKRGKEALNSEYSVLKDYTGRAVHDCWPSYFDYKNCLHSLCCAHLLRELLGLAQSGSKWAVPMHDHVLAMYRARNKADGPLEDRDYWLRIFHRICRDADEEEPPTQKGKKGRPKSSKGRNLLHRLVNYTDEWFAFAFEQGVPFTNNQAERDIRVVKTKQKVATNFQTLKGARHFARIQAFASTLRKHSMNVFKHFTMVLEGKEIVFRIA